MFVVHTQVSAEIRWQRRHFANSLPIYDAEMTESVLATSGDQPAIDGQARFIQLVPWLASGDAIGQHVRQIDRLAQQLGISSVIVAQQCEPGLEGLCHPLSDLVVQPNDVVLFHFSSGSTVTPMLELLSCRVIVDYHNITPSRFFESWSESLAAETRDGRRQLGELSKSPVEWVADSAYNAAEIVALGKLCSVLPILIPSEKGTGVIDQSLLAALRPNGMDDGPLWLFVGRLTPNKAQHDVIGALSQFQRTVDARARLVLVGSPSSSAYGDQLVALARDTCVTNSVIFHDALSAPELNACYAACDVFLSMSEHEGFCVPLVEAMQAGLPIVAFDAGAVGEVGGSAVLLVHEKSYSTICDAVERALGDSSVRAGLAVGRVRQLERFVGSRPREEWRTYLSAVVVPIPRNQGVERPLDDVDGALGDAALRARGARHASHQDPILSDEVRALMIERNRLTAMPTRIDVLRKQVVRLREYAQLDPSRIQLTSRTSWGRKTHSLIGKLVSRQTNGILQQVNEFTLAATNVLADMAELLIQSPDASIDPRKVELDALRQQVVDLEVQLGQFKTRLLSLDSPND